MTRARELANFADDTAGLETLTVSDVTDLSVSASNINSATNQITDSSTDLNVDSNTLVVDKSADRVGIGTTAPGTQLHLVEEGANLELKLQTFSDTESNTNYISFFKADGTAGSPGLVDDDCIIGGLTFYGYDGSNWHEGALIKAQIDGTPSDGTDMPTELVFATTADGAGSPTARMVISPSGNVGIGTTPSSIFHVDEGSGTSGFLFDSGLRRLKIVGSNSGSGYVSLEATDQDGSNATSRHLILEPNGGKVGIGITAPVEEVHITGDDPTLLIEHTASTYGEANLKFGNDSGDNASQIQYDTTQASLYIKNLYPISAGQYGRIFFQQNVSGSLSDVLTIDNRNVSINNGNLVIGTAGKGIDFSNSSSSYGISGEVLKHAESGTWTPTTKVGSTTQSLSSYSVAYDKIGNLIFAHGYVRFNISGTGRITVALPINPNSAIAIGGGYWFDLGSLQSNPIGVCYPVAGDQHLLFMRPGVINRSSEEPYLQHSDFTGNRYIYFSISYRKA